MEFAGWLVDDVWNVAKALKVTKFRNRDRPGRLRRPPGAQRRGHPGDRHHRLRLSVLAHRQGPARTLLGGEPRPGRPGRHGLAEQAEAGEAVIGQSPQNSRSISLRNPSRSRRVMSRSNLAAESSRRNCSRASRASERARPRNLACSQASSASGSSSARYLGGQGADPRPQGQELGRDRRAGRAGGGEPWMSTRGSWCVPRLGCTFQSNTPIGECLRVVGFPPAG